MRTGDSTENETATSEAIVVFGVTGDLVHKQIFPALQGLVADEGLDVPIIGVARSAWTDDDLRNRAKDSVQRAGSFDAAAFEKLARRLVYVRGDYGAPETYLHMREAVGKARNPVFYMAIPPSVFPVVTAALAESGYSRGARVIIEKPFGRDLASAVELNETLHAHFPESAIFRIDHFLGKEPVQNITYTRFANSVLEPIWNRDHIRSIQITQAEDFGVGNRGGFYEEAGAVRDVLQNHLLQLLAILMMDPPAGNQDSYGVEKTMLLRAVRPLRKKNVVRGQYQGYRSEKGVDPSSNVETFVAVHLEVDSWRWAGVPVYIRAGKKLAESSTEAFIEFKRPPREAFGESITPSSSHLRVRISPDVFVALGLRVKIPGERMVGEDAELTVTSCPRDLEPPYQRLLADAMRGKRELFASEDGVEASWRIVDPILNDPPPVHSYRSGSWGPAEARKLIGVDGPWINPAPGGETTDRSCTRSGT
ncbi:MAG: glucose-6-phosphate dehydrogenase [Actinobacteria bacterium]|nr:glucose-6-phosphate dehydrogenase [Actinomycetota bacterium]